jgi:hypothetical protein
MLNLFNFEHQQLTIILVNLAFNLNHTIYFK